ncbi:hypothetical protein RJ640_009321 [Escallonia rubra]|uniref:Uncharacterized protein n=1 Tax=Escallonia rubra TaxID=112253 RepID=A0AA88RMP6_9ASTE|nr:hypothetical protein RJ640_009321 [Escallonia rubra]
MAQSFGDDSIAFSDCNSYQSDELPNVSSQSHRLLIACTVKNSDDLIGQLVAGLKSTSIDEQKQVAMEIRQLVKNKPKNRVKITRAGAIRTLIFSGTSTAKENAACALLRLAQSDKNKVMIRRSGAILPLVNLLKSGNFYRKKDASTALYAMRSVKENKVRAVEAGIMKSLVELMVDLGSGMVDKSAFCADHEWIPKLNLLSPFPNPSNTCAITAFLSSINFASTTAGTSSHSRHRRHKILPMFLIPPDFSSMENSGEKSDYNNNASHHLSSPLVVGPTVDKGAALKVKLGVSISSAATGGDNNSPTAAISGSDDENQEPVKAGVAGDWLG